MTTTTTTPSPSPTPSPSSTPSPSPSPAPTPRRFVVVDSAAAMPSSCWGVYRRVGVVEIDPAQVDPTRTRLSIDARRRGVVRVVETWERCNVGSTDRCAYRRALREAQQLADVLDGLAPAGPPPVGPST